MHIPSILFTLFTACLASEAGLVTVIATAIFPYPRIPIYEYWDIVNRTSHWSSKASPSGPEMQNMRRVSELPAFCTAGAAVPNFVRLQVWRRTVWNHNTCLITTDELNSGLPATEPPLQTPDNKSINHRYKGNLGFVSTAPIPGMVPLYRRYNPGLMKHNFSLNPDRSNGQQAVSPADLVIYPNLEGVAAYVWERC